jgi:hypothetical protein
VGQEIKARLERLQCDRALLSGPTPTPIEQPIPAESERHGLVHPDGRHSDSGDDFGAPLRLSQALRAYVTGCQRLSRSHTFVVYVQSGRMLHLRLIQIKCEPKRRATNNGDPKSWNGSMRKQQINWEVVFWLLCGAAVMLAFWQYGSMVSSYAD